MKSLEGLLLLLSLVAGGITYSMGAVHGNIASLVLLSAIVALLAFAGSALISSRLIPDEYRPAQGWTARSLLVLSTGEGVNSGIKLLAASAGLLNCLSMLLFGFWAGFVFIYSFAR